MKRHRIGCAVVGVSLLLLQSVSLSAAPGNAGMRAKLDARRWFVPQFRITALRDKDVQAMPQLLIRLGQLPYARDHAIVDAMIDLPTLAKSTGYKSIPDDAWAPVDQILEQMIAAGLPRILPTLTFKLDPSDPILSQYCAQQAISGGDGRPVVSPAIANGSCLPQYANADYRALFTRLTGLAVRHLETRFGSAIIGYEPVGGVAGEIDWKGTSADKKPVFGDVSPSMLAYFRQHMAASSSMTQATLSTLNARVHARFPSWDEVVPPSRTAAGGPEGDGAFAGVLGEQFALARAEVMTAFYIGARDTVRQAAPTKLFSLRMGAIVDPTAVLRGSIFLQQYADAIQPDLMASDASTFNHLYEAPVVAPTIYRPGPDGRGIKKADAPMWMSFADRVAQYTAKNKDYRQSMTQQLTDCFNSNGFRAVGFYMNPSEFLADDQYGQFLASLGPYFDAAPKNVVPDRFVSISLSKFVDQPAGGSSYADLLRTLRAETHNFAEPVAIQLTQDIAKP